MRKGGGKQKGSAFEREICVSLSKWLTGGKHEDIFWRSAMSGGRSTVAFKHGKRLASQVGDISCINPIGTKFIEKFAPECKRYANLDYQGLITGKGKLLEFWAEINTQADRYGKYPVLFARQNRLPTTICLTHSGLSTLGWPMHKTLIISRPYDLYIVAAERFFVDCPPFI